MAAAGQPAPVAAAAGKKRPKEIHNIPVFTGFVHGPQGYPALFEMAKRNPILMAHSDRTSKHLDAAVRGGIPRTGEDPLEDETTQQRANRGGPPHHQMLSALVTQYYEWNHVSTVKLQLKDTMLYLHRIAGRREARTVNHLMDFEQMQTIKKRRLEEDTERHDRCVAEVETEQLQEYEQAIAEATQRQQQDPTLNVNTETMNRSANDSIFDPNRNLTDTARFDDAFDEDLLNDFNVPTDDVDMMMGGGGGIGMMDYSAMEAAYEEELRQQALQEAELKKKNQQQQQVVVADTVEVGDTNEDQAPLRPAPAAELDVLLE